VGKLSFDKDKLVENTSAVLESIVKAKPASAKGDYIQSATLSSSMSPGVPLEPSLYAIN
jgi:large subunit ribosomal protein L1